jgi:hypothetical protein
MTRILQQAFTKASKLPVAAQKKLATQMLEDIEGELKWDKTLEKSQSLLESMAEKAIQEHRRGRTKQIGFDEL